LSTPATAASLTNGLGSGLLNSSRHKENMWVNGESMTDTADNKDGGRLNLPKS